MVPKTSNFSRTHWSQSSPAVLVLQYAREGLLGPEPCGAANSRFPEPCIPTRTQHTHFRISHSGDRGLPGHTAGCTKQFDQHNCFFLTHHHIPQSPAGPRKHPRFEQEGVQIIFPVLVTCSSDHSASTRGQSRTAMQ